MPQRGKVGLFTSSPPAITNHPPVFNIQRKNPIVKSKPKPINLSFSIDCSTPVEDEIMDSGAFVSSLFH